MKISVIVRMYFVFQIQNMAPTTRKKSKPKPVSESESEPDQSEDEPESDPQPLPRKKPKRRRANTTVKRKYNPLKRQNESPEQKARRLVREKERVRRRRANETPEQREHRLKVARESRKRRYDMIKQTETPEQREERMKLESDLRWLHRKCETAEQRRARQKRDAARQREMRSRKQGLEPPEELDGESIMHNTIHMKHKCANTKCSVIFVYVKNPLYYITVTQHEQRKGQRVRPKIPCPVCSVPVQEDYLDTHLLRHQGGENSRPFRCSVCPKTYTQFAHLKEHRRRHFNIAPLEEHEFYCEICSTIIYTRVRYLNHLRFHTRKTGLQLSDREPVFLYICDYDCCQLCFRDKSRFVSHLESHSSARVSFDCSICKKPFAKESNCKNHMELAHQENSDNIIDCPYCHLVIENKAEDWEWHYKSHQLRLDERSIGTHLCEGCGEKMTFYKILTSTWLS